jgi:hypothetical protein
LTGDITSFDLPRRVTLAKHFGFVMLNDVAEHIQREVQLFSK